MSEARLIVGLGNPGKDYELTRHNLGFLAVQRFADEQGLVFRKSSFTHGFVAEGNVEGAKVYCLLPSTYMNESGIAVKQALDARHLDCTHLLTVCDDMSLDFGLMRIRGKGSDGGHNGLASIIACLNTQVFSRLRLGIGSPARGEDAVDYVLGRFKKSEERELDELTARASECCRVWLKDGIHKSMDTFNRRKKKEGQ